MTQLTPTLLGQKHSIVDAEHTLQMTLRAFREGDLRLTVSRGITAVIQASIASVGALLEVKERADQVIQSVRKVIHGIAIQRAVAGLSDLGGRRRVYRTEAEKRQIREKKEIFKSTPLQESLKKLIQTVILTHDPQVPPQLDFPSRLDPFTAVPFLTIKRTAIPYRTAAGEMASISRAQLYSMIDSPKLPRFIASNRPTKLHSFLLERVIYPRTIAPSLEPFDVLLVMDPLTEKFFGSRGVVASSRAKSIVERTLIRGLIQNPEEIKQIVTSEAARSLQQRFDQKVDDVFKEIIRQVSGVGVPVMPATPNTSDVKEWEMFIESRWGAEAAERQAVAELAEETLSRIRRMTPKTLEIVRMTPLKTLVTMMQTRAAAGGP